MPPEDVISLLNEAGITPDNIGVHRGQYHLSRYGDKGRYVYGNCRFITMEENLSERVAVGGNYKRTQEHKDALSKAMRERHKNGTFENRQRDTLGRFTAL